MNSVPTNQTKAERLRDDASWAVEAWTARATTWPKAVAWAARRMALYSAWVVRIAEAISNKEHGMSEPLAILQMKRGLRALYLEVPTSVGDDLNRKFDDVLAYRAALEAKLDAIIREWLECPQDSVPDRLQDAIAAAQEEQP